MIRCVRYAAAVLFALLAAGFLALWARSYCREGVAYIPVSDHRRVDVGSFPGLLICRTSYSELPVYAARDWFIESHPIAAPLELRPAGFSFQRTAPAEYRIAVPHWLLIASSLGLAALFAFKRTWRYSLRTILVATTLLAALLGLAVYAV